MANGLLRPGAHNLLLGAGLGLLGQGPSLTPQSSWGGLGRGLMMGSALNQSALQSQQREQQMALKRQQFEAEQARRMQQAEGYQAFLGGLPQETVAALGGTEALIGLGPQMGMDLLRPHLGPVKLPPAAQLADWWQSASPEERQAAQAAAQATKTPPVSVSVGPQGFQPQTDIGKTMQDLQAVEQMSPGPAQEATKRALRAKLAKQTQPTAEVAERETKYATILEDAERMMELREENPGLVGPIEGRMTKGQATIGLGGEAAGAIQSLEASMMTQLGTALSGAAIPTSEWPKYYAQIPLSTDSDEIAAGKMKELRKRMEFLGKRQAELRGETPVTVTPLPAEETIPRTQFAPPDDLTTLSTDDLLRMLE